MISEQIRIINRLGLHARAAASFVKLASSYDSDISLVYDEQSVNGKSIMGIMMLAASQGTNLLLEVNGTDETAAARALLELINSRFGEDE
ncbi:MAG TPA: HPr family phosphocarrier protein [Gammaproteobacteria bacterium]|nr:phosphocarrier protein HPr [bacterium BMS3Abin11]GMT40655.1 MAG: phosphocarrier protein HPr [bacterium]HDH16030.1 HPr family phosphocarrier protein [Gammaproteobacteria bacterium]HDZ79134.1 HPr family phosphocarrier protein [Gammaproteobacteria bacterium]